MLKSLIQGVGMGTGMGIGQELSSTLIQHVKGRMGAGGGSAAVRDTGARDIQCGKCGQVNTGDSRFCGECGNTLVSKCQLSSGIKCACGFVNAGGQKFCSECGASLAARN